MVILLKSGAWYPLDAAREPLVREAYRRNAKRIDLYGDESAIVTSSGIDQLLSDEQFDDMEHRKARDLKCRFGFWHSKGTFCDHSDPKPEPINLDYLREGRPPAEATPTAKRWFKLIKLNFGRKPYGTLTTLAELDQFEVDGIWPDPPPMKPRTRTVMRPKPAGAFPDPDGKVEYVAVEEPME